MSVRHLFVIDPLEGIDPSHDTTFVIMKEVQRTGGEVWVCQSRDLYFSDELLKVNAREIRINDKTTGEQCVFERVKVSSGAPITEFDRVWMREDPPFDQSYLHATYMLSESPVPVINDPDGIRSSNEKMFILRFPEHIPETWVGSDPQEALNFVEEVDRAVVKTLSGYGGEEVYRVEAGETDTLNRLERLTERGENMVMAQRFIPSVTETGDRRIIVLGGEPIGGLTRMPSAGDFRANLHSGGSAGEVYLTDSEKQICDDLKPELLRRGLYLVGLDLIDDQIVEINVTSPTCVQEINPHHSEPLEREIVRYAEQEVTERIDSFDE